MRSRLNTVISYLFYGLFFLAPLVVIPATSELFEFNKIIVVYIFTALIVSFWLIKMVVNKKFICRRTILDLPLILFLVALLISTFYSIDSYTSIFGYYSRFNGGFLSILSFALLYWAFVSNIERKRLFTLLKVMFTSALLVSIYGILEHFGIDKHLWVQDVQNRVFSTLGQPNWLAAFLVAVIPISWAYSLISQFGLPKKKSLILSSSALFYMFLSSIYFLTLLYTKSRSGILAFACTDIIFWSIVFFTSFKYNINKIQAIKVFAVIHAVILILIMIAGTPFTPKLTDISSKRVKTDVETSSEYKAPALEVGGTESGEIRKIVWKGAIDIFKHYPYFGSGVETFAYSYYNFRPQEHNLVSEWDFLYNKAHNEYLNYLATTGILGTLAYLTLITASVVTFIKALKNDMSLYKDKKKDKSVDILLNVSFLSSYFGILVTNFFGFSVVSVSLFFFLLLGFSYALKNSFEKDELSEKKLSVIQISEILLILFALTYILVKISVYWYADTLYAKGKSQNDTQDYPAARLNLTKAIDLIPNQAIYYDELSESASVISLIMYDAGEIDKAKKFSEAAIEESEKAIKLSPYNLNIRRNNASLYIKLSILDPSLLEKTAEALNEAVILAPTDAKLFYNLALTLARLGLTDEAISVFEKTVELKENYRNARFALSLLYIQTGEEEKAREQLEYVLKHINPEDQKVRNQLEEIS